MTRPRHLVSVALTLLLCACQQRPADDGRPETARDFPVADRPVSEAGKNSFASEAQRDSVNEANVVMDLARIEPGMSVADIGAGEGYYTAHLAARVGPKGRVLAEEIDAALTEQLGTRVMREGLENVSIKLGKEDDPSLPPDSFDRIFLVHMYHEVTEPYAFLWRLRPALRKGGKVIVVDIDRPTDAHGTPPALLFCEFASVGFRLTEFVRKPELQGYYAQFEAAGVRPSPENITPCRVSHDAKADLH
ncbi:class I SAM-dependent methyltransferase [Novosphingobium mangrovi (ex Huang et al. 2023)]|uniref:Class I SAM-dependent methyltransferase n=1 Tax=Novosphingobium mangrovi (ex Huang et al. 2023) TaxID=2976432 RepID=A0ABT2I3U3_9SPHN|nr:class I SAM-dependent methyltransferase [Novosphingobium mangrovi (ex Huang et al. 2023)]MCT2399480.1 class I SAM-dependent methyltransferase [Novosphingobium mangrovi (ex Huang et al. 2023)]